MTRTDISDPPRVGPQSWQEEASLDALKSWLTKHQWKSSKPEKDVGQDLWVEIFDDSRFTGLSLYIQHKSALEIDDYKLKTTKHLSYPLKVKDLRHWEKAAVPVYIIICSVENESERYWISSADAIAYLDRGNPAWREKLEKDPKDPDPGVNVRIPLENRLDESGLGAIRHEVADHFLPIVSQGKQLEIFPVFADTPEGAEAKRALKRLFEVGGRIQVGGKGFSSIRMSEWWERIYGRLVTSETVLIVEPVLPREPIPVRLEIEPSHGPPKAIPYLDLKVIKGGSQELTLSNQHQDIPLHLEVFLRKGEDRMEVRVNFELVRSGNTVYEAAESADLLIALSRLRSFRMIHLKTGDMLFEQSISTVSTNRPLEAMIRWANLLEKLSFVQGKIAKYGTVSLRDRRITDDDVKDIFEMYQICKNGRIEGKGSYSGIMTRETLNKDLAKKLESMGESKPDFVMTLEQQFELLGVLIPLGETVIRVSDSSAIDELRRVIRTLENSPEAKYELHDVPVVVEYPEWMPKDENETQAGGQVARVVGPAFCPEILRRDTASRKKRRCSRRLRPEVTATPLALPAPAPCFGGKQSNVSQAGSASYVRFRSPSRARKNRLLTTLPRELFATDMDAHRLD